MTHPEPADKIDELLTILAHPRRRNIVTALTARAPRTARGLAETITPPTGDPEQTHLSILHVHIPRLADAGVIIHEHDEDTETNIIHRGSGFEEYTALLDLIQRQQHATPETQTT